MAEVAVMLPVELPDVPEIVTLRDVEQLKERRQKHEQELRAYEEETRRQRRELRKMKKDMTQPKAVEKAPDDAEDPEAEEARRLFEEQQAKIDQELEQAFQLEEARLREELQQLRVQKDREEVWARENLAEHCYLRSKFGAFDEGPTRPPSDIPSAIASAVSSTAPSRSSSPANSDAAVVRHDQVVIAVPSGRGVNSGVPVAEVVAASASNYDPSAQNPTPRKGGKGKGKGNANVPPPPPTGNTPRSSMDQSKPVKLSKFVNFFWKATQRLEPLDEQLLTNDTFVAKVQDPCPRSVPVILDELKEIVVPCRPATIFEPGVDIEIADLPEEMVEYYFKRCEAAVKMPQPDSGHQHHSRRHAKFLDQKRLYMLGIMLQKHLMEHKESSPREAILSIKRGVLRCDFKLVKLEGLSVIRTVLRKHLEEGSPLCVYVKNHGDAAIWELENPEHHYLVHELTKVPQVDERLECMLFFLGFQENMTTCRHNLGTLQTALEALMAKKDLIMKFFQTAHRLGQSVSQKPSRGFQLSTLDKLTLTKSTKMPHLSILHFVLALMRKEDTRELFTEEDIVLLRNAKSLSTAKVCDECRELAQGLYGVKQIYENGEYTSQQSGQAVKIERRRLTLPPAAAAAALTGQESAFDTDDRFHEVMQTFVVSNLDEADDIVVKCHKMLLMYKELALFFDDLNNVYPPPKEPTDKKLDLVDVFYRFAKVVPQHRRQVEEECLRELITL
jgi:hypothetical protein